MVSSIKQKLRKIKRSSIYKKLKQEKVKRSILLIVFTVLLFTTIIEGIVPERIVVVVGDIATEDIRATKDITDAHLTDQLKEEAKKSVDPRYRVDTSVQVNIKEDIKKFFNIIKDQGSQTISASETHD